MAETVLGSDVGLRNAQRFLSGIEQAGLKLRQQPEITLVEKPGMITYKSLPHGIFSSPPINIAMDGLFERCGGSANTDTYAMDGRMYLGRQPFRMVIVSNPTFNNDDLNIVMPVKVGKEKPMLLNYLRGIFDFVAVRYDFVHHPQIREHLADMVDRRIPAQMMFNSESDFDKSRLNGRQSLEGLLAKVQLYLQDPNPYSYLKCYEVELERGWDYGSRPVPPIPKVVPEAVWQKEEAHFCMIGNEGYPFIPLSLKRFARLHLGIHDWSEIHGGKSKGAVFDLLGDFPLTVDWNSQWYATKRPPASDRFDLLQVLFNPEWRRDNFLLRYRRLTESISPEEAIGHVKKVNGIRKTLTERLAA